MKRFMPVCLALAMLLAIPACASRPPPAAIAATYVVVRHAEKGSDDARDPSLNAIGEARAMTLARQFITTPLTAAYATAYKRTQQTAQPAAAASGIAVTPYDASGSVPGFVAAIRRTHPQGTILVVGHSNTVPNIVAALCDCVVAPLGEHDYDRLYEVRVDRAGRAVLAERSY